MAAAAFGKKEELYGYKTLYREIGYYITRLEQYERSLRFFDEAIKKTPDDRRARMGRAWARSKACKYEGALEDIRKALKLDPDDLVILAHKALNTYLNCEFEDGLVQNTRLMPKRRKPESFSLGAMHCADAIENCLGERAGRPLRDHYLIIRNLAWKKNFDAQKGFQPKSRHNKKKKKKPVGVPKKKSAEVVPVKKQNAENEENEETEEIPEKKMSAQSLADTIYSMKSETNIQPPPQKFPYRPLQRYSSNIANYMAEKYLDTMYKDKIFLKELSKQQGVECPNKEGTEKILQLAKTGYKTVKYKQELLRSRRPFYFIKYQEAHSTGGLQVRQEQDFKKLREKTKKDGDAILNKVLEAVAEKKWKLVLEHTEKLREYCDRWSKKVLPDRDKYMDQIYDSICQAHFDLKRLNKNHYDWDHRRRIYKLLGLPLSREPSTDSVICNFKNLFVNRKKQINIFSDLLRKASKPKEFCWIYHELARFHLELKHFELARLYSKKCMTEAKKISDQQWIINTHFLLMRVNIGQHSKNEAKTDALDAIEVAKKMHDQDLVDFMLKCKEIIDNMDMEEHSGSVLQQREQKIVEMMSGDKMKDEAAHLFRMMSAMPAARRMSVMPGIKLPTDEEDDKKVSTRPSIMPNAGKPPVISVAIESPSAKSKDGPSTLIQNLMD